MPYAQCPHCKSTFHLRLTQEGVERWQREHAQTIEAGITAAEPCFQCWKELRELDVVEVLKSPEGTTEVVPGEQGAIVAVLRSETGEVAYEVEAVAANGHTKWLHTFERSQLKAVLPTSGQST
jgi:hypothetical protein